MKKIAFVSLFLFFACNNEIVEIEGELVCNRDFECSEYPTWETWDSRSDGYFQLECEPCWFEHHREQKNNCCVCDIETYHKWCSEGEEGIYYCNSMGSFDYFSCAGYCRQFGYSYGDTCVEIDGEAQCDCRNSY